ncbi:MAG: DsbA family oxidoreductase [Rhodospirillales bacterium]|nr:MAG: DsbA family oxidoreductase [Rhodospirillales bacterium]
MGIEVVFDPACPWCYIGKRRLEHALAERPGLSCRIGWWPFLLHPELPPDGVERRTYLNRRFGTDARVRRVFRAITDAGQSTRIDFAFDRIGRTPNSLDAHRLARFAGSQGRTAATVEALFHGHFEEGRNIGDRDVLVGIGAAIGLDPAAVTAHLDSNADVAAIYREHVRAQRFGIAGVPAFVFNGTLVISGAQEPRVLVRMLDVAREYALAAADTARALSDR